jgi:Fuc2NAc and GlcNAc transferase
MMGGLLVLSILIGWALTGAVRFLSAKYHVLDVPNDRSAHRSPTPTLGGVALVIGFWTVTGIHVLMHAPLPENMGALLVASGMLCLLVRDEFREMGRLEKLGVQILAAFWMVKGGVLLEAITVGDETLVFGRFNFVVTVFVLVLLQNLYNFMDGLDGFAAMEGVLVSGFIAYLFWSGTPAIASVFLGIAGVTLGFWLWNRPPARIFMGDLGAHFLPLAFGYAAISGESSGAVPFWLVILPLSAFLFDAIYTLMRRLIRGENITRAHRFHLYQRLQEMGCSPGWIQLIYGVLTVALGVCAGLFLNGLGRVGSGLLIGTGLTVAMGTLMFERAYSRDRSERGNSHGL